MAMKKTIVTTLWADPELVKMNGVFGRKWGSKLKGTKRGKIKKRKKRNKWKRN